MAAVQKNAFAIQSLPPERRTHEVCLAAVQIHGVAIRYLNAEQRTPEVCLAALQQNMEVAEYLDIRELVTSHWDEVVRKIGPDKAHELAQVVSETAQVAVDPNAR